MGLYRYSFVLPILILMFISCSGQKNISDTTKNEKISISKDSNNVKPSAEQQIDVTAKEKIVKVSPAKDEYYSNDYLRYEDFVYKDYIKTVYIYRAGFELSPPLLDINTDNKLILSFDDLDGDVKNYKYYFIHCDADWKPSVINDNEFINGFREDFITEYKHSFSTRQSYTHYELEFPNDNMQIVASGNYILVVYFNDNKEDIAFTRRFWVVDTKVTVNASVRAATNLDDRNYKQEIDFSINKNTYEIQNPYYDLKVAISQNWRWDNALHEVKPQIVKDDIINYNFNGEITFNGGNEFRRFDIKSIRYNSERISNIFVDSVFKNMLSLCLKMPDDLFSNI